MDKIKKFAPLGAVALGIIALIMVFLPSIAPKIGEAEETINGFKTAFGDDDNGLKFSIMNCLTWALLIGGIACAVLSYMQPDNQLFGYIAIAALFVAGIFFFCALGFTQFDVPKEYVDKVKEYLELGSGSIIAGICSILAAICAAAPVVMDKLNIK
jgi:hypothetical protein